MNIVLKALVATLLVLIPGTFPVRVRAQVSASPDQRAVSDQRVLSTARSLLAAYDKDTGLFRGTGWWNSANAVTALVNVSRVLHTTEFDPVFQNSLSRAQNRFPGFLNEFYDDEGWWALAWLDVYSLRGGDQYLKMSESIFADMTGGWSEACGGGIWWKKNEHYKNAIANELFLAVASRLAELTTGTQRAEYSSWVSREGQWFLHSGMINGRGLINDGLDQHCQNNQQATWSYNQGVILTGLAGWSELAHDPAPLQSAATIATAAEGELVDAQGVLHDPCEPDCGADGAQFKGIFVRNLATLAPKAQPSGTATFLMKNATAVWYKARTADGRFSARWSGPPADGDTGTLISALDALTGPMLAARSSGKQDIGPAHR